jgi:hypothetical protein
MRVSSTYFNHKNIHKTTWADAGSSRKAQLDHVLVDTRHASDVLDVRSYRCSEQDIEHHDSDHFLVGAKLRARVSNINQTRGQRCRRLDVDKLQQPGITKRFRKELDKRLSDLDLEEVEWSRCCDLMTKTAEEVLGYQQAVRNEWFDDECLQTCQAVIEARKGRPTRRKTEIVRELQRKKKQLLRKKQRQHYQQLLADVETLHNMNDSRKFYQAISKA